jgi:hypothetical protein
MRTTMRKTIGGTLAGLAMAGGALVASPPAGAQVAPMAGCGYADDHHLSGAAAFWRLSCANGNVTVTGWVRDTASNGRCAQVKVYFPNRENAQRVEFSQPACPKGDEETFSWTNKGSSADVLLFEYDS